MTSKIIIKDIALCVNPALNFVLASSHNPDSRCKHKVSAG